MIGTVCLVVALVVVTGCRYVLSDLKDINSRPKNKSFVVVKDLEDELYLPTGTASKLWPGLLYQCSNKAPYQKELSMRNQRLVRQELENWCCAPIISHSIFILKYKLADRNIKVTR